MRRMTQPHLRVVSEQPVQPPLPLDGPDREALVEAAQGTLGAAISALDDVLGLDALDELTGEDLLALHDRAADAMATLQTVMSVLADRINKYIWATGRKPPRGGAVATIAGAAYQATMTGGPGRSLKVPEQVSLGHAIFEKAINATIENVGLDPTDQDDEEVSRLRIFGSILDALIVGNGQHPGAARLTPMKRILAAGLVDRETGEITQAPEGQIRWGLDVANYETPTTTLRRRSFARVNAVKPPPEEPEEEQSDA